MTTGANERVDYADIYNEYWLKPDRVGESSADLRTVAEQVLQTCGVGTVLDIGCGEGLLVKELLKQGIDASGIDVSRAVVDRCNSIIPERFFHGSVLQLPFSDASFRTVVSTDCLEHLASADVPLALAEIYRVAERFVFLQVATTHDRDGHWHLTVENRAWWEQKCFEAGFRKHPAYYRINDYETLNNEGWQVFIVLEKVPLAALTEFPLAALTSERDLHMDMLRESGSRSDAHVFRYHIASKYVRRGDTVLDVACGLGYGTHVLVSQSTGGLFHAVDASDYAIRYAQLNFGSQSLVEFTRGVLPDCLAGIEDASVDVIVSFETLEHILDPKAVLNEFHRILTPGGRLIASVPNDWSDETGTDPNPYHYHVYDHERFLSQLDEQFDIEHLFGQTADRVKIATDGCVWEKRSREWREIALRDTPSFVEAEWLIAVAAKSPLGGEAIPYVEKLYSQEEVIAGGNAVAFARDYDNPWLLKSLVAQGWCTENKHLRAAWALAVADRSRPMSADAGAALCVLVYRHLDGSGGLPWLELHGRVSAYIQSNATNANPSVIRWINSLRFALGLSFLEIGQRDAAFRLFSEVSTAEVVSYHPTLLTKASEATYWGGIIQAASGEWSAASEIWRAGLKNSFIALIDAMKLDGKCYLGSPDFVLREVSHVLAMLSRLSVVSALAPIADTRPSVFYDACQGDSVSQIRNMTQERKAFAAATREHARLAAFLSEVTEGKAWLEEQWRTLREQLDTRDATLAEVLDGKDWLEEQWRTLREQLDARDATLAEVTKGKDWLEEQWRTLQEQLDARDATLAEVIKGKDWLEEQWRTLTEQLDVRDVTIAEVVKGKDSWEQQSRVLQEQVELRDERLLKIEQDKTSLESQMRALAVQYDSLKRTWWYRTLYKLGIVRNQNED